VSAEGRFVFGFGRDARSRAELVVRHPRRRPADAGGRHADVPDQRSTGCRAW
jgi:hypothetical protein